MTRAPEPASRDTTQASHLTKPLREMAAFALLAANALLLLVGLIDLAVPTGESFPDRAAGAFFSFAGLVAVLLPVLAVVLATHVQPAVPRARLITQIALAEYGVSAALAFLAFLAWLGGGLTDAAFRSAITGLLTRLAYLAIFAVAAFVVVQVWRGLYHRPRRKTPPGTYGQPTHQQGGGFPPGYPPPPSYEPDAGPGQPGGYGPPGYGQPGGQQPPVPAQPAAPQPTRPGEPSDETQVLNRPDRPGGIATTQRFEPVHPQRDPGQSPDQSGERDAPQR